MSGRTSPDRLKADTTSKSDRHHPVLPQLEWQLGQQAIDHRRTVAIEEVNRRERSFLRVAERKI